MVKRIINVELRLVGQCYGEQICTTMSHMYCKHAICNELRALLDLYTDRVMADRVMNDLVGSSTSRTCASAGRVLQQDQDQRLLQCILIRHNPSEISVNGV